MRFYNQLYSLCYLYPIQDKKQMTELNVEMYNEINKLYKLNEALEFANKIIKKENEKYKAKVKILEKDLQWHEDIINEFFIDNELELSEEVKQDAHLRLGIEFEYEVIDD